MPIYIKVYILCFTALVWIGLAYLAVMVAYIGFWVERDWKAAVLLMLVLTALALASGAFWEAWKA